MSAAGDEKNWFQNQTKEMHFRVTILAFNPLLNTREHVVRVRVSRSDVRVLRKGKVVKAQVSLTYMEYDQVNLLVSLMKTVQKVDQIQLCLEFANSHFARYQCALADFTSLRSRSRREQARARSRLPRRHCAPLDGGIHDWGPRRSREHCCGQGEGVSATMKHFLWWYLVHSRDLDSFLYFFWYLFSTTIIVLIYYVLRDFLYLT